MITADNKRRILSVVNIFETDDPDGKYDDITILPDGKNHERQVTYGRSQTTEQGNLKDLIVMYIANKGTFADDFRPYVSRIGVESLVDDRDFKDLLIRAAREDNIMKTTQDAFFDKHYYEPAFKFFTDNGFDLPLSMLVIYDSYIHSNQIRPDIRSRFSEVPPAKGGDEKAWITAYVKARQDWLSEKSGALARTVYRTEAMMNQIIAGNWLLTQAVNAHDGMMSRSLDI